MLRTFCRGGSLLDWVDRDSIWSVRQGMASEGEVNWLVGGERGKELNRKVPAHHLDGCIGEINEFGQYFAILAGSIKFGGIPEGEDGADELGKALGP